MKKEIKSLIEENNLEHYQQPTCVCCKKSALSIPSAIIGAEENDLSVEEFVKQDTSYVAEVNSFICDECYRKVGSPKVRVFAKLTNLELVERKIKLLGSCQNILKVAQC